MKPTETKGNGLALLAFLIAFSPLVFLSTDAQALPSSNKFTSSQQRHLSEENLPPNPTADDITVIQMAPGYTQVNPNDPNTFPQTFTYSLEQNASNGKVSVRGNKFFYTARAGFIGNDSFIVKVTDSGVPALSGFKKVNVNVVANNLPVVSANDITTFQSKPRSIQVSFTDSDSEQGHTFLIYSQPTHGTASINSQGVLTYSPNIGYSGPDSLSVGVKDTAIPAGIGTKTLNVTVTPNAIPVVLANDFSTFQSRPATTQVGFSDIDSDQRHTLFLVTKPSNGTALLTQEGVLTYTPKIGFSGQDTLIVGVSDNAVPAGVGQKVIHINVTPNTVPVVVASNIMTGPDSRSKIS